jgi:predicted nucleotide-binding protein
MRYAAALGGSAEVEEVAMARGKKAGSAAKVLAKASTSASKSAADKKRTYLSQGDVPSYSVTQAIRVPRALAEHYAFKPATPLNVAAALDMQPSSSTFRQLCGAAIAYGLTKGGYNAPEIALEPLGLRVVRPTKEGDEIEAKREALLKPRVVGEFLRKYEGAPLPREDIGRNVLIEMGVPQDRVADVQEMILEGAEGVGILRTIKDKRYVDLSGVPQQVPSAPTEARPEDLDDAEPEEVAPTEGGDPARLASATDQTARRVFVTHGKNRAFVDPIKKLLGFGEMEPVISVERTSVSQPVPDKVMHEMRSCGSAIIHVDAELNILDRDAKEHTVLNPNVLIEIGAAMALYGRRFILLVRDGVKLPSNLQGLFEVRYAGEALDGDATIRLLEAINDIKNHPIPDRYSSSK